MRSIESENGRALIPPWDISKDVVVYRDGRYTLGQKDRRAYMIADGAHYDLGCHPYEPCLYITKTGSYTTTVHNAFDPFVALEAFMRGETIQSITGRRYTAGDFCRMVEFAAGMNEIGMNVAEEVFGLEKQRREKASPAMRRFLPQLSASFPMIRFTPSSGNTRTARSNIVLSGTNPELSEKMRTGMPWYRRAACCSSTAKTRSGAATAEKPRESRSTSGNSLPPHRRNAGSITAARSYIPHAASTTRTRISTA